MGSNVPHKGSVKAGRLSPVVFGNFPIKSAMARLNGELDILDARKDGYLLDTDLATNNPLKHADGSVASGEWKVTTGSGANDLAYNVLNPDGVSVDASQRLAMEFSLQYSNGTVNLQTVFAGVIKDDGSGGVPTFLASFADNDAKLAIKGAGVRLVANEASPKKIQIARHDGTSETLVDTGETLAAAAAKKIGLVVAGDGRMKVFVDDKLVKKVPIPGGLDTSSKFVVATKSASSTSNVLFGRLLAGGVAD